MDGRGEAATTSYGRYRGGAYERLAQVELPHSLVSYTRTSPRISAFCIRRMSTR